MTRPVDMPVTFVVPAYRSAVHLHACLTSVGAVACPDDQLLVAFDGPPTDGERAVVAEHPVQVVQLPQNRGPAAARNAAVRRARHDIVFFVDADVEVAADARARAVGRLDEGWDAVVGAYEPALTGVSLVTRLKNLQHSHTHLTHAGPVATFWTGCSAVRRDAWLAVGGFDESLRYCEDIAFGAALDRAGRRILLDPAVRGRHRKQYTVRSWLRSDIVVRALPWTALLLDGRAGAGELNTGARGRVALALAGAVAAGAIATVRLPRAGPAVAMGALAGTAVVHADLLRFAARHDGRPAALAMQPFLVVHYLAGGTGLAVGALRWLARRLRCAIAPRAARADLVPANCPPLHAP